MILLFLIDALRHDFVSKEKTPFLADISKKGALIKLQPTLAFEGRPAFFSGLYPENSNIAFRYIYDPKTSPYRIAPLINILPIPLKYKRGLLLESAKRLFPGQLKSVLWPREIPLNQLKYFNIGESDHHWEPEYLGKRLTLFDILRKIRKPWAINSWPSPTYGLSFNGTLNAYVEAISEHGTELSFFYSTIADTDWTEHKYGPDSEEMELYLQVADRVIEIIFNDAKRRTGEEPMLLVFGDHGAVSVKKIFNLEKLIIRLPLKPGKDFVYLLDSASARFWFHSSKGRHYVQKILNEQAKDYGKILTDKELNHYHFNVVRELRGDILFMADPGVLIFPNIHNRDIPEKGMHGYDPEHSDEHAAAVIYTGKPFRLRRSEKYETVDIFPTVLTMLGVGQVPDIDGKTIIEE